MQAVRTLETGTILNEYYTFEEYINRRGGWLGKQPDYARMPTGLFSIARRDAQDVFQGDHALSVQEVRRRERAHDIDPLLPLPTTDNTESLDNFQSYPDREWSPGITWLAPRPPADDEDSVSDALETPHSPAATFQGIHAAGVSQTPAASHDQIHGRPSQNCARSPSLSRQSATPPGSPTTSAYYGAAGPNAQTSTTKATNKSQSALSSQQTTTGRPSRNYHQRSSDQASQLLPSSSSPMAELATTGATTPAFGDAPAKQGSSPPLAHAGDTTPQQAKVLQGIIDALGQPQAARAESSSSPDLVDVDGGIASLAGRGIRVPVKQKRGTKRAASESPTDSVIDSQIVEADQPMEQRPVKRLKLKGPRDPSTTPPHEVARPEPETPAPKRTRTKTPTKKKQKARSPSVDAEDELEAVIAGTALPTSRAEAVRAAKARHERLFQQHQATNSTISGANKKSRERRTRKKTEPDFLPEFFNPNNFAPGEEMDSVRCVCGAISDDSGHVLSCDQCNVWQHNACMGAAVPKNPRKAKYMCQMCDPWAHRELLARLRRQEGD